MKTTEKNKGEWQIKTGGIKTGTAIYLDYYFVNSNLRDLFIYDELVGRARGSGCREGLRSD